jgi:hypothetical protein
MTKTRTYKFASLDCHLSSKNSNIKKQISNKLQIQKFNDQNLTAHNLYLVSQVYLLALFEFVI